MRVLYLSDQDLDNGSGVSQKILTQSRYWSEAGHEVTLLSLESLSFFSLDGEALTGPKIRIERRGWNIFRHLIGSTMVLRHILADRAFDLVYMRYRLYAPFFKSALRHMPLIVEINSDDIQEYGHSSWILQAYNKMTRRIFLMQTDGFICVSRELQQRFRFLGKPIQVVANGVAIDNYSFHPATAHQRPSMVFIGSPGQAWQGVDKVQLLADKLPEYDFHIIGVEGKGKKNLIFHGYMYHDQHQKLIAQQDVGIGTLSLYRKNMKEASPLKVRQYLAQGLPIIYAYEDTDLSGEERFALKLCNCKSNLDIDTIRAFVSRVFLDNSVRREARSFCQEFLDYDKKEWTRLQFFEKILNV